jgi:hypothetical protein
MRKLSLTLAVLLLAVLVHPHPAKAANAATPANAGGGDLLRQITSPAPTSTPAGDPGCKSDLQQGTRGAIFATGNNCGSCSDRFCQGSGIGNACAGGMYNTCQAAYGNNCPSQPELWQCICWPPGTPFP